MNFQPFNADELKAYANEAKDRWGNTEAYREYERRNTAGVSTYGLEMMKLFAEFGKLVDTAPESETVQNLVSELQRYITEHFYTCTDQILAGLGEMYTADDRFRQNIDHYGGKGTAEFVNRAIKIFVNR